jgi:hypothetical protein
LVQAGQWPTVENVAAFLSGGRANIDNPIGMANDIHFVLHHK